MTEMTPSARRFQKRWLLNWGLRDGQEYNRQEQGQSFQAKRAQYGGKSLENAATELAFISQLQDNLKNATWLQ